MFLLVCLFIGLFFFIGAKPNISTNIITHMACERKGARKNIITLNKLNQGKNPIRRRQNGAHA